MENQYPAVLQTKQHFEILDGLRGVAALAVVVFHFMEWVYTDYSKNFIGHGYLAVDFFFCLSGFVIGYAYDSRLQEMGWKSFFTSRLIRLHPLVILGSIFGLIVFLVDPFALQPVVLETGKIIVLFLCSIVLIPLPIMPERGFNLFGFNAPAWSLFWEYVANIFYALVLYKIPRWALIVLTAVGAIVLCVVSYRAGNLMGGWGGPNFWDGCARVTYSFSAGLLIFRFNWIINNKFGFILLAIVLSAAFVMPYFTWNWLAEALVVIIYFPLIVSLGAGSTLSSAMKKVCVFSGNISYPLYMTHYAGISIFAAYFVKYKPVGNELTLLIAGGTIVLVGFAYLVMVLFDLPIRKYLNSKRGV